MGDVVRFPVEKIDGYFDETRFRPEPAAILILPVVRVDRPTDDEVMEAVPAALRRHRELVAREQALLSPGTEKRVRKAFKALSGRDAHTTVLDDPFAGVSIANLPEYDPGPAIGIGPLEIGTWPWPGDTGDETD